MPKIKNLSMMEGRLFVLFVCHVEISKTTTTLLVVLMVLLETLQ
jgi:hypothetical protein